MTDAPERIWAGNWLADVGETSVWDIGEWRDEPWHYVNTVEYVRADLATPLNDPRVKALVEAGTELHDKAVEKHQRHRSDIWPVIRKLRAALEAIASPSISALEENK